jgi:hypothetical protein
MEAEDVVEEDLRGVGCGGCGSRGNEVDHLGEGIDKDDDGVESRLGTRELRDEVHRDLFPGLWWDWQRLKEAGRRLLAGLDSLAGVARLHVVPDVAVEAGPVADSVEWLEGPLDAWVSRDGDVVVVVEDLGSEWPTGNAEAVVVVHEEFVGWEGVVLEERGGNAGCDRGALEGAEDGAEVWVLGKLLSDLVFEFGGGRQRGDGGDLEIGTTRDGIGHDVLAPFQVESLVFKTLKEQGPTSRAAGE